MGADRIGQAGADLLLAQVRRDIDGENPAAWRRAELPGTHLSDDEADQARLRLGHQEDAPAAGAGHVAV